MSVWRVQKLILSYNFLKRTCHYECDIQLEVHSWYLGPKAPSLATCLSLRRGRGEPQWQTSKGHMNRANMHFIHNTVGQCLKTTMAHLKFASAIHPKILAYYWGKSQEEIVIPTRIGRKLKEISWYFAVYVLFRILMNPVDSSLLVIPSLYSNKSRILNLSLPQNWSLFPAVTMFVSVFGSKEVKDTFYPQTLNNMM